MPKVYFTKRTKYSNSFNRYRRTFSRVYRGLADSSVAKSLDNPYQFIQCADTQFGMEENDISYAADIANGEKLVTEANRLLPFFVIVCGDLTNFLPEFDSSKLIEDHPYVREKQIADFKSTFAKLNPRIPLILVCGNHDVGNRPTAEKIKTYKKNFGDDYFVFYTPGVTGIVINTNLIADPSGAPKEYQEHMEWIESVTKKAKEDESKHILFFGHHPLFLQRADEPTYDTTLGSDNFVDKQTGNTVIIPHSYYHIPLEQRLKLLNIMQTYDVKYHFCGHYHRNCVAYSPKYNVTNVTTSAVGHQMGKDQSGYRLVTVFNDSIRHVYHTFP
jgi:serine/threonine-protein phosphatase CPPED1